MLEDAEAFCGRVHPRLVRALTVYLGDREVATELCQEALVRAWQRWPAVAEMRSPDSWVFRVAFNLANSTLRRRLAERRAHARLRVGDASMQPASDDVLVLRAAVDALPPRQRAAVVLRHLLDMSVEDTADALGCAPGTVKSLTAKGVMHLRDLLGASFVMSEEP
jgi:RNA polymerase sigma-70 factor (sigma-E family)